jgi:hypothetical protein
MVLSGDELLLRCWIPSNGCGTVINVLYVVRSVIWHQLIYKQERTFLPLSLLLWIKIVYELIVFVSWLIDFAWMELLTSMCIVYMMGTNVVMLNQLFIYFILSSLQVILSLLSNFLHHLFVGSYFVKQNCAHGCLLLLLPLMLIYYRLNYVQ